MSHPNTEQIEHWNGPEASHWIDQQDRYDRQLAPFADVVLRAAAIGGSDRVLDLGCGCGGTTLLAAHEGAEAVGVDISAPMLAHAGARAAAGNVTNVRFEQADVQTLGLAPASFDAAISRFGIMFLDDPVAAFASVAHALRPGGRPAFVCWQELGRNDWLLVPGMAAAQHVPLPDLGPAGGPGMFSFAEPDRVLEILEAAGFVDVDVAGFETPMLLAGGGTIDEALEFLLATGIARVVEVFWTEPDAALVERARRSGEALVAWQVGSPDAALAAEDAGCDFVVAQGVESGGHVIGTTPRDQLLAAVLARVSLPVVVAGGIANAADVARAIRAGAAGVRVGTAFVATKESGGHPVYIDALLAARSGDDTVLTTSFREGWPDAPHRVLKSARDAAQAHDGDVVGEAGPPGARYPVPRFGVATPNRDVTGDVAAMALYAGTGVGEVNEIRSAEDVVAELVAELA